MSFSNKTLNIMLLAGVVVVVGGFLGLRSMSDTTRTQDAAQLTAKLRPSAVKSICLATPEMTSDELVAARFIQTRIVTDSGEVRSLISTLHQSVIYYPFQGKPSGPWRVRLTIDMKDGTVLYANVYNNPITNLVFVTSSAGAGPAGLNDYLVNRPIGSLLERMMQTESVSR